MFASREGLTSIAHQAKISTRLLSTIPPNKLNNAMATIRGKRLKKNAKYYASDDTGKHPHIAKEECINSDCSNTICATLCASRENVNILGHETHKPRIGHFCQVLSDVDATGAKTPQYFVRAKVVKTMTDAEAKVFENNKEMTDDPLHSTFLNSSNDILEKFKQ